MSEKSSDGILEGIEAEIKENEKRMTQIEDEAKKRVIHIYINQNTGTIIRHNGNKFVPKPPLRYGGTQGGRPHMHERNTIEYLKARNQQLRGEINNEIDKLYDDSYASGSWPQMALSKWTPNGKKRDGFCTAPQNDQNRASCIANCEGIHQLACRTPSAAAMCLNWPCPMGEPISTRPDTRNEKLPKESINLSALLANIGNYKMWLGRLGSNQG